MQGLLLPGPFIRGDRNIHLGLVTVETCMGSRHAWTRQSEIPRTREMAGLTASMSRAPQISVCSSGGLLSPQTLLSLCSPSPKQCSSPVFSRVATHRALSLLSPTRTASPVASLNASMPLHPSVRRNQPRCRFDAIVYPQATDR